MSVRLLPFREALGRAEAKGPRGGVRHPKLLIGNGFSIACEPRIFTYRRLLEQADFSSLSPYARSLFDRLETQDFELVIRTLNDAVKVAEHYGSSDRSLVGTLRRDADGIKDQLARTIAKHHPEHPASIPLSKYRACREFLQPFESIYSLNYDLLLYWALMQDDESIPPHKHEDGFRYGDEGPSGDLHWDPLKSNDQNVTYLHGALHLFDKGSKLVKINWKRTNVRLVEQIRRALAHDVFPRIVAEGTCQEKLERINHSGYLHRGYRSILGITGDLFVFGMSMTPNDDHILDCLTRGKVERLFVGVFGDPSADWNLPLIERAERLVTEREQKQSNRPLKVEFYDAADARPWG